MSFVRLKPTTYAPYLGINLMAIAYWEDGSDPAGASVSVTYVTGQRIAYTGDRAKQLLPVLIKAACPVENFR